nr:DUF285 domain-containing protein [Eubacterium sp.]
SPTPAVTKAYGVLTSSGAMYFVQSADTVKDGKEGSIQSISGETYSGTVFTGFDSLSYTASKGDNNPTPSWHTDANNYAYAKRVKSIEIVDGFAPNSMHHFFCMMTNLQTISGLEKIDTSKCKSLSYAFYGCSKLKSNLDLSSWDTSSVANVVRVFNSCKKVPAIDTSSWDLSNCSSLYGMFVSCESLTELDLSNYNTESVTSTESMFEGCRKLASLNLAGWNLKSLTNDSRMFSGASSLSQVTLSANYKIINNSFVVGRKMVWNNKTTNTRYTNAQLTASFRDGQGESGTYVLVKE